MGFGKGVGRRVKQAKTRYRKRAALNLHKRRVLWSQGRLPFEKISGANRDHSSTFDCAQLVDGPPGTSDGVEPQLPEQHRPFWSRAAWVCVGFSLALVWFCRLVWDPNCGVRIGEASNPGPYGSDVTDRKRGEGDEASLTDALLQVLQSYAPAKSPEPARSVTWAETPKGEASPKGKGKSQTGCKGKSKGAEKPFGDPHQSQG